MCSTDLKISLNGEWQLSYLQEFDLDGPMPHSPEG